MLWHYKMRTEAQRAAEPVSYSARSLQNHRLKLGGRKQFGQVQSATRRNGSGWKQKSIHATVMNDRWRIYGNSFSNPHGLSILKRLMSLEGMMQNGGI